MGNWTADFLINFDNGDLSCFASCHFQIGEWSMMSGIKIDDITWPGDDPTPPKGRPDKYHIKVVTIPEKPYIVHSDPDKSGHCPAQAALCRIAPENQTNGYVASNTKMN